MRPERYKTPLTGPQLAVLRHCITHDQDQEMLIYREIISATGLVKSSVQHTLDRLETVGYIARERYPESGRVVPKTLEVTEAGRAAFLEAR